MSNPFDPSSSVKHLEWLSQFKKFSAKAPSTLTPQEIKTLQELELKLSRLAEFTGATDPGRKRTSLRVPIALETEIKTADEMKRAFIRNISGGGLFLEGALQRPMGAQFDLNLKLPGEKEGFRVRVEVAWISTKNVGDLKPGMGVKFLNLEENHRQKIQRLIDSAIESKIKGKST